MACTKVRRKLTSIVLGPNAKDIREFMTLLGATEVSAGYKKGNLEAHVKSKKGTTFKMSGDQKMIQDLSTMMTYPAKTFQQAARTDTIIVTIFDCKNQDSVKKVCELQHKNVEQFYKYWNKDTGNSGRLINAVIQSEDQKALVRVPLQFLQIGLIDDDTEMQTVKDHIYDSKPILKKGVPSHISLMFLRRDKSNLDTLAEKLEELSGYVWMDMTGKTYPPGIKPASADGGCCIIS